MPMGAAVFWAFLSCVGAAAIVACYRSPRAFPFLKPVPLAGIAIFFLVEILGRPRQFAWQWLILAALVLGLCGDVLLLSGRLFVHGLTAFLIGHIAYVAAFLHFIPLSVFSSTPWLACLAAVVVSATAYAFVLSRRMEPSSLGMRGPVAVYIAALSAMLLTAVACALSGGSILLPVGAVLFYFSDAILAWHLLVKEHGVSYLLLLAFYYTAQGCLCWGSLAF